MKPSLKIHDPIADSAFKPDGASTWMELSAAFCAATGWALRLDEDRAEITSSDLARSTSDTPSMGTAPGTVSLELSPAPATTIRLRRSTAERLARAIGKLLGDLAELRHALWQREAELAAGVPVACRPTEPEALAERLDAVLRGGCEAIGNVAAALYLLDAGTSQLKLRSAWGLARRKLADPPRLLRGSTADLEALTGHAVVLATAELCRLWHAPENAAAAVCVPVASSTLPLGTLWFFAAESRDFDDRQTQLAEIIAGRLATDLEREVLLADAATRSATERRERSLTRWTLDQNAPPPLHIDGWHLAATGLQTTPGEAADATALGAATFFDWFTAGGTMIAALGRSHLDGPEGHMAAAAVRAALRAHAPHVRRADALLTVIHDTLGATFAGNVATTLAVAIVTPKTGWFHFAAAGDVAARVERPKRPRKLAIGATPLGGETDCRVFDERGRIAPGDRLSISLPASAAASLAPSLVVTRYGNR